MISNMHSASERRFRPQPVWPPQRIGKLSEVSLFTLTGRFSMAKLVLRAPCRGPPEFARTYASFILPLHALLVTRALITLDIGFTRSAAEHQAPVLHLDKFNFRKLQPKAVITPIKRTRVRRKIACDNKYAGRVHGVRVDESGWRRRFSSHPRRIR